MKRKELKREPEFLKYNNQYIQNKSENSLMGRKLISRDTSKQRHIVKDVKLDEPNI